MYSRDDLIRILQITPRQLTAWERAGLVPALSTYSFSDLSQIKKVRDLCGKKVRPGVIRQSVEAMRKQAAGMENALREASTLTTKSRVAFRHEGKLLEPVSGQFLMDFAGPARVVASSVVTKAPEQEGKAEAADLFARGMALEEDPSRQLEAIETYRKVLAVDPHHAAAHINLGTLCYNRQDYATSEQHYRAALQIDPRYALAYFDLGNVLDETGRVQDAIEAYSSALRLAPTYADAHYNLALAYEKVRQPRKALQHWRAYVKLDTSGPWTLHARNQIAKILSSESLKVVYRNRG